MHRNTAYFLSILILIFWWKNKSELTLLSFKLLPIMLVIQVLLGITTILLSTEKVPIFWGVAHQSGALILLTLLLLTRFGVKKVWV